MVTKQPDDCPTCKVDDRDDAQTVMAVLGASDQPMTTELLLAAAHAYEALRSSRRRERHPPPGG